MNKLYIQERKVEMLKKELGQAIGVLNTGDNKVLELSQKLDQELNELSRLKGEM